MFIWTNFSQYSHRILLISRKETTCVVYYIIFLTCHFPPKNSHFCPFHPLFTNSTILFLIFYFIYRAWRWRRTTGRTACFSWTPPQKKKVGTGSKGYPLKLLLLARALEMYTSFEKTILSVSFLVPSPRVATFLGGESAQRTPLEYVVRHRFCIY